MTEKSCAMKAELLASFGILIRPLYDLVDDPDYMRRISHVETRFVADEETYRMKLLRMYGKQAQIFDSRLFRDADSSITGLRQLFDHLHNAKNLETAKKYLENLRQLAMEKIDALPCDDPATIMPAKTPFSTYRTLLDIFQTTTKSIEVFDPYMGKEVFDLYLNDVRPDVEITLVVGKNNRAEVVAAARLLAIERPTSFRLLYDKNMHDRWIRMMRDHPLHVGGSLKDAAIKTPFSLGPSLENPDSVNQQLDALLTTATEWFGKTQNDPNMIDQVSQLP
ncbi:MAG: hypothetical protein U0903_12140 [Planctomycetales bacterium]